MPPEKIKVAPAPDGWANPWLDNSLSEQDRAAELERTMPQAREYLLPGVRLEHLARGTGRMSILRALIENEELEERDAKAQVFAGINGVSLVQRGRLFSDLNPLADSARLNAGFFATQVDHWLDILGEVKFSPFTYIYKARRRGDNPFPAIVGFSLEKLEPTYHPGPTNIQWSPVAQETTESTVGSIYYLEGMFQTKPNFTESA